MRRQSALRWIMRAGRLIDRGKRWAKDRKRDVIALWIAARDPRVPWPAKALCAVIAAYALSPVDLIPDFIPVIGYLDELVLLPLAILLAVRLVPQDLMVQFRAEPPSEPSAPSAVWRPPLSSWFGWRFAPWRFGVAWAHVRTALARLSI